MNQGSASTRLLEDRPAAPCLPGVYLVTVTAEGRSRRVVWDAREALALNHPATLFLEEGDEGIRVLSLDERQTAISVLPELLDKGGSIPVGKLVLQLRRMKRPKPAYLPVDEAAATGASDYFLSSGYAEVFLEFRPLGRATRAFVGSRCVARILRSGAGLQVEALVRGVTLAVNQESDPSAPVVELQPGASRVVGAGGESVVVSLGEYWWRVRKDAPESAPEIEQTSVLDNDAEAQVFHRTARGLVTSFLIFAFLTWINVIPKPVPPPPPVEETPLAVVKIRKSPVPPPAMPKVEQPKPPQEKPKEKKVAEVKKKATPKPAPKKAAQAPKQPPVAQKPAPAPKSATLAKGPPAPAPKGKMVAPPAAGAKPQVSAAQLQAAQNQARLSKSLGFLSAGAKGIASRNLAPSTIQNPYTKYQAMNSAPNAMAKAGGGSYLSKVASQVGGNGFSAINTKNARGVSGGAGVKGGFGPGGRGKGLNEVQGKVSLAALYDPNAGDGMGSSLGGGGLALSGQGKISESLLMKVLEKYMQKFQYCYEKSLLTNPSIAGTLVLQWTIQPSGQATGIKVVRSELNHAPLHQCVSGELGKITFPGPKGGSVTVKFPFAFSSSAL